VGVGRHRDGALHECHADDVEGLPPLDGAHSSWQATAASALDATQTTPNSEKQSPAA
jgi:hypothetical protein